MKSTKQSSFVRTFFVRFVGAVGALCTSCALDAEAPRSEEAERFSLAEPAAKAEENATKTIQTFCPPSVYNVSPIQAKLNQSTTFTIYGSCLPSTTAFWIAECAGVSPLGYSPTQVVFACTPQWTKGSKPGVVKDQPGGIALKNFTVNVQ